MKNSRRRNVVVASLVALCATIGVVGTVTYALFTSNSNVNIAVTSGNIDVKATVVEDLTTSHKEWDSDTNAYVEKTGFYSGEATLDTTKQTLTLSKMLPMDKVSFKIKVENKSDVTVKYRTIVKSLEDTGLLEGLKITIDDEEFDGIEARSSYVTWGEAGEKTINVVIEMPEDTAIEYTNKSCKLSYLVEAIQGNAKAENYEVVYPTGVNKSSFPEGKPVVYENVEGVATYVADIKTAANAGASIVYVQEDSTVLCSSTGTNRTDDIKGDLTIYGNRCDFNFGQLGFNQKSDSDYNTNVNVYNSKNLFLWGYTPKNNGYTYNLSMYGCTNSGKSPVDINNRMIYISGSIGTVNETLVDCTYENGDSALYSKADGTYNVKNCKFSNSVTPIKFSHKTTGNAYVKISNSTFDKCGYSSDMGSYGNPEDAAAIKLKSMSHMEVTLKNVAITNTVGTSKTIWLNLDGNSTTDSITGSATNVTVDGTEWTFPSTTPNE